MFLLPNFYSLLSTIYPSVHHPVEDREFERHGRACHNIPEETIRRRYHRSRSNFWYNYKDMADKWYLFDNSSNTPEIVANRLYNDNPKIINIKYFDFFKASIKEG